MKIKLPELSLKATGFTNLFDVDNHIRKMLSPVINQINVGKADEGELAEVVKVYATEEQLDESPIDDEPDYKFLGAIRFRKVFTQQHIPDDQLMVAYPLSLNVIDFPVKGETVFIQKIYDKFYYTDRVNMFNNPNNAAARGASQKFNIGKNTQSDKTLDTAETGISENKESQDEVFLGEYFRPNFNVRSLVPNEGDTLIQGRFGNTLRLGSINNSPTIKLRAGQISDYEKFDEGNNLIEELEGKALNAPLEENINLDASSMWMTTDETVSLTPATLEDTNIYPIDTAPEEFSGKQIIFNSGRLIFNSKENGILGFSNGPIDFSTLNSFGVAAKQGISLYAPNIIIGREDKLTKNIVLKSNDVSVRADKGDAVVRANRIILQGPLEGEQQRLLNLKSKAPSNPNVERLTKAVRGAELEDALKLMLDIQKKTTKHLSKISQIVATLATKTAALIPPAGQEAADAGLLSAQTLQQLVDSLEVQMAKLPNILSDTVELE
tara:strand:+ start:2502 stop:3986 length:1485 start_codon:yes stop_codon:yes gene_type:complete